MIDQDLDRGIAQPPLYHKVDSDGVQPMLNMGATDLGGYLTWDDSGSRYVTTLTGPSDVGFVASGDFIEAKSTEEGAIVYEEGDFLIGQVDV
jgi:hypothetical protein